MSKQTLYIISAVILFLAILIGAVYFFALTHTPATPQGAVGPDQYATAILACYHQNPGSDANKPIPNNSIQNVEETSRMFINLPKSFYPQNLKDAWTTVSGNATGGYVSNGGLPGEAGGALSGCWSTYVDFEGSGEVDLRVKSIVEGAPDYFVRFIVSPLEPIVIDKTAVDPALLIQLQTDLQGIKPYFVDTRGYDGKPLTPQEDKIKNDIVDILTAKEPANREFYSQLWPIAIGKRYVLITQPARTYYDILIDSQTGETPYLQNAASYIVHRLPFERPQPASNGRQTVLYIGYQDIYTYTLDDDTFVLVPGSKLSGNETYHNGRGDFSLMVDETHTDDAITISVYDGSQVVQNPYAQPNALQTMNKKLREVTLSF